MNAWRTALIGVGLAMVTASASGAGAASGAVARQGAVAGPGAQVTGIDAGWEPDGEVRAPDVSLSYLVPGPVADRPGNLHRVAVYLESHGDFDVFIWDLRCPDGVDDPDHCTRLRFTNG